MSAHPAPELLVSYALGADDPGIAPHVADCPSCRVEIEALQEAAGIVRGSRAFESHAERPDCPDGLLIADFVDGRLAPQNRAPVVEHLLTCARCRRLVKASSDFAATLPVSASQKRHFRQRWMLPVGLAAAAMLVVLLRPRDRDDSTASLREPALTSTIAPTPITPAPGASVPRLDRLVWSSVPKAETYRVRLYDGAGSVLWTLETPDTSAALPNSLVLAPRVEYFWRVEAQAEWMRWAASDLASFRISARR